MSYDLLSFACTTSHVCARVSTPSMHKCMYHASCFVQSSVSCMQHGMLAVHTHMPKCKGKAATHPAVQKPSAAPPGSMPCAMPFTCLDSFIEDLISLGVSSIQANCSLYKLKYLAFMSDMRGSFSAGFCTAFYVSPNSRLLGLAHLCCCTNDPPGSSRTMMAIDCKRNNRQ